MEAARPDRPKPPVVEPAEGPIAAKPPKDAVVLFDGSNLDAWKSPGRRARAVEGGGRRHGDGAGGRADRDEGEVRRHPAPRRVGRARPARTARARTAATAAIFLMGQFEIQVLDSYKADTYADGQAGAIYGQYPPLFNASRPPGEWQTYDIAFRRPRFDASGKLLEPARITLVPQRHPRAEQRGAVRADLLAQVARPTRTTATAARSRSRTTTTPCGTATSGSASCPSDPPRPPTT